MTSYRELFADIDKWIQMPILIFGVFYMWCFAHKETFWHRRGHWVVVCIQPLWWATTLFNGQMGVFVLSVIYFALGLKGLYVTAPNRISLSADLNITSS